ncbi:MAG: DNA-directed RNA polymerase subunit omega [Bacteroidota bacterium]
MDYKKIKCGSLAVTRNLGDLSAKVGNLYESVSIISKRANQISLSIKEELHQKISEFQTSNDNLEEIFENREQIEIARFYEQLPKPTLLAIHEFMHDQVYFRNPAGDDNAF